MTTLAEEIREDFAKIIARFQGMDIAAVKLSTIEKAAKHIAALEKAAAEPKLCACCDLFEPLDLVAHQQVESRANPLAAAFAVNAKRGML